MLFRRVALEEAIKTSSRCVLLLCNDVCGVTGWGGRLHSDDMCVLFLRVALEEVTQDLQEMCILCNDVHGVTGWGGRLQCGNMSVVVTDWPWKKSSETSGRCVFCVMACVV